VSHQITPKVGQGDRPRTSQDRDFGADTFKKVVLREKPVAWNMLRPGYLENGNYWLLSFVVIVLFFRIACYLS